MTQLEVSAPPAARWICRTLEEAGFETWAVGGAVRDAILGRASTDWDFATRATPDRMRRLFRRTVPIGIEHGTVGVLSREGVLYEVTTFRRDVETDGRHAVVEFADSVEEDLARRDFTINAIAWHPLDGRLYDPFGGAEDLHRGVLRTVGEARERFREDYLRILRALRFAGRFGLSVHDATWEALVTLTPNLVTLSPERIRDELLKVLESDPSPRRALELYASSGALAVLYPEIEAVRVSGSHGRGWEEALGAIDGLSLCWPDLRLAALVGGARPAEAAAVLSRLRLSKKRTEEVAALAEAAPLPERQAPDADLRRWLSRVGTERARRVARLALARVSPRGGDVAPGGTDDAVTSWRRLRAVMQTRPPLKVSDLAIDGRTLVSLGFRPGPYFGDVLDALLDAVLEDPDANTAPHLTELATEAVGRLTDS